VTDGLGLYTIRGQAPVWSPIRTTTHRRARQVDSTARVVEASIPKPTLEGDGSSGVLLNAVFGAAITAVATPFVPFAPLLGGALSGYLDAGSTESGAKIGAISGAIALVPLLIVVPLLLFVLFLDPVFAAGVLLVVGFVAVFLVAYTIGLGALGGILGVYIKEEFGG